MPDLWLAGGHFVGRLNCPLLVSQPGQLRRPSLWGRSLCSNPCTCTYYSGGTI